MRILFVCSGNNVNQISQVVLNQGLSLEAAGQEIDFYLIKGKGISGYLKNISPLRKYYKEHKPELIHAHYSLSAFIASFVFSKSLVVSLMGSDAKLNFYFKILISLFQFFFRWRFMIVKSPEMKEILKLKKANIIPNGVDINLFKPVNTIDSKRILNWNTEKKHILFAANPQRPEKNYILLKKAVDLLTLDAEIHVLADVEHKQTPVYFNASDVVVLSSIWEGSPNVIKEAMACNCPVVSTDVGDVRWLFGDEEGYFIADFLPGDFCEKLILALNFSENKGKTKGRERIIKLGLDSTKVAEKIINIYRQAIANDRNYN